MESPTCAAILQAINPFLTLQFKTSFRRIMVFNCQIENNSEGPILFILQRSELTYSTVTDHAHNGFFIMGYWDTYKETDDITNSEHRRKQDAIWYQKNKKHASERQKQYRSDNLDKYTIYAAKRRAMKLNQTPELTQLEQDKIKFIYEVCSTMADHHIDHIQPLSKGGLHTPGNLQILSADLNMQKGAKWPLTPEEEIKYKGYRIAQ